YSFGDNNVPSLTSTSRITSFGMAQMNSAFRTRQSKLFARSASTTPPTLQSGGITTSNGYPLTWLVIGHRIASPTLPLYASGESTTAGRRPACSCPALGSYEIQTASPRFGTYQRAITTLPARPKVQSLPRHLNWPGSPWPAIATGWFSSWRQAWRRVSL